MLMGVFLHAMIAYEETPGTIWIDDPNYQSIYYDYLYVWIHAFRMPLFFVVAGYFARFLIKRVGVITFLRKRLERIVIPFLASIILIRPLSAIPFEWYRVLNTASYETFSLIEVLLQSVSWNGLYHLWFLYYLIWFYIASVTVWFFAERFIAKAYWQFNFGVKNAFLLTLTTFGLLFFFYDLGVEPWTGLKLKAGQFLYYGIYFGFGIGLHYCDNLNVSMKSTIIYMMVGTIASIFTVSEVFFLPATYKQLFLAVSTVSLTFGMFGVFQHLFSRENKALRYISDSAYWLYLVHLPLVCGIQLMLIDTGIPGLVKFLMASVIPVIIALVSYEYLVRYSLVGRILHGRREKAIFLEENNNADKSNNNLVFLSAENNRSIPKPFNSNQ